MKVFFFFFFFFLLLLFFLVKIGFHLVINNPLEDLRNNGQNITVKKKKICTPGMGAFNAIYPCLENSFCSNLMNSNLKSVAHQRNTPHLKDLGVIPQKLQND